MKKMFPLILFGLALVMVLSYPVFAAGPQIQEMIVIATAKGSVVTVNEKIMVKSAEPVKEMHLEALKITSEEVVNVTATVDGTTIPVQVTKKEGDWANRHVVFYVIKHSFAEPMTEGQSLSISYNVDNSLIGADYKVPLFVPKWKMLQTGVPFKGTFNLPKGTYFTQKSLPISYETVDTDKGQQVKVRALNAPYALLVTVGKTHAGFFNFKTNWTLLSLIVGVIIAVLYTRYEKKEKENEKQEGRTES